MVVFPISELLVNFGFRGDKATVVRKADEFMFLEGMCSFLRYFNSDCP